jgi:hypothetical protein
MFVNRCLVLFIYGLGLMTVIQSHAQTCNPNISRTAPDSRYEFLNNDTEVKDNQTGLIWCLTCASSATSTQPIIVLFFMILRYSQFLILLWVLAPYASSYTSMSVSFRGLLHSTTQARQTHLTAILCVVTIIK